MRDQENAIKDFRTGEAEALPWIRTYGLTEAQGLGAKAFDTGWRAAKAAVAGAACPFAKGSISAAAWYAATAFHEELGQ